MQEYLQMLSTHMTLDQVSLHAFKSSESIKAMAPFLPGLSKSLSWKPGFVGFFISNFSVRKSCSESLKACE